MLATMRDEVRNLLALGDLDLATMSFTTEDGTEHALRLEMTEPVPLVELAAYDEAGVICAQGVVPGDAGDFQADLWADAERVEQRETGLSRVTLILTVDLPLAG